MIKEHQNNSDNNLTYQQHLKAYKDKRIDNAGAVDEIEKIAREHRERYELLMEYTFPTIARGENAGDFVERGFALMILVEFILILDPPKGWEVRDNVEVEMESMYTDLDDDDIQRHFDSAMEGMDVNAVVKRMLGSEPDETVKVDGRYQDDLGLEPLLNYFEL